MPLQELDSMKTSLKQYENVFDKFKNLDISFKLLNLTMNKKVHHNDGRRDGSSSNDRSQLID